jgi:hypothetical protein
MTVAERSGAATIYDNVRVALIQRGPRRRFMERCGARGLGRGEQRYRRDRV